MRGLTVVLAAVILLGGNPGVWIRSASARAVAPADTGAARGDGASVGAESDQESSSEEQSEAETGEAEGDSGQDEATSETGLKVLRAYICKGIDQSEPTEAGKSFLRVPEGILRLCCFSEIGGAAEPDTVVHVWYWGDREMARVSLHVEGPRWRTWSTKRILEEWRGEWRVAITDRAGHPLATLEFSVE